MGGYILEFTLAPWLSFVAGPNDELEQADQASLETRYQSLQSLAVTEMLEMLIFNSDRSISVISKISHK
jgi:hypothetical protein